MFVVRPVKSNDLDAILHLANLAKAGITTLPQDREILKARLDEAVASFRKKSEKPGGQVYLFVMEDTKTAKVVGTCSVISKLGGYEPSYTYEIKTVHKKSKQLNIEKDIQYLHLKKEHSGPSEVGTLFLDPSARESGVGRLLSLSRFLFMAQFPECFEKHVIAELRGYLNEQDSSPFWTAVCKHFFEVDFKKADLMSMTDKSFIKEIIPQHPIYIPLLPISAQEVIGRVHKNTEPAMHMLLQEGFELINEIDIFEAGPVIKAKVKDVRTVKSSQTAKIAKIVDECKSSDVYLVANNNSFNQFKISMGPIDIKKKNEVILSKELAGCLNLNIGDQIRYVTPR